MKPNGCSVIPQWMTSEEVEDACDEHDIVYEFGETALDKLRSDFLLGFKVFNLGVKRLISGIYFILLGPCMTIATSIFGWLYWKR